MSVTLRDRLLILTDRLLAVVLATLVVGTTLAFGGAVWWARPAVAILIVLFGLGWLVRAWLEGACRVTKSPLVLAGLFGLMLALVQLAPLPGPVAGWLSSRSRAIHTGGLFTDRVDASIERPEPVGGASPVSVDRSATLRWLVGASACLALFWGVGQFTDRLRHLLVVWGSVVAAFFANTTFAIVQLLSESGGLYGFLHPGSAGPNAPSLDNLLTAPNSTVLRLVSLSAEAGPHASWAVARPAESFLVGSLMGGPGAYLALGALGLPLGLGLTLHILAPRGSREDLWMRLSHSGSLGLVALLSGLVLLSAGLIGLLAGPWLSVPFVIGLCLVGLPVAWPSGLRWTAVGLTGASVVAVGLGVLVGAAWNDGLGIAGPLAARIEFAGSSPRVWGDAARVARDFPVCGSGLGSFAAIEPYYKTLDRAHTTAQSSLLQWLAEAGVVGLLLFLLGAAWCGRRLPAAIARVGTADRTLAFSLLGTVACFGVFSALHWTVELMAVALAASAVGGTLDRWLAGGTDLFVERS
jgi:O-antigen ligase